MTTGKTITLTRRTVVGKVMSLLFNMLSRLIIAFLPMSKYLLILWLKSPSAVILEPPKNKVCHCFHCFPIYLPWSDGTRCHILVFWVLSFKPTFSLSSFIFIKRLFSSLSAIRVVSSAYLGLLIFLLAILIPACASSSPAFLMMYSACKLNKQGDNIKPWRTPFPNWNQCVVPCSVLTVASWPAYKFLRRQVKWSGISIFKNFPVGCDPHSLCLCVYMFIHTVYVSTYSFLIHKNVTEFFMLIWYTATTHLLNSLISSKYNSEKKLDFIKI